MKIVINGAFPGLNQFIDANRISRGRWNKGNQMKQQDQNYIASQLPRWRTEKPVYIHYSFFCADRKKDPDNIAGYFHKVFQDALVQHRTLKGDGWKYIKGFSDEFHVDSKRPRVEIELKECN